jgi:hypothetical protein
MDQVQNPSESKMIKLRRIIWAGNVARMRKKKKKSAYRFLLGNRMEETHWEEQGGGGWIILRWILERYDGVV